MTVAQLIDLLKQMPAEAKVNIQEEFYCHDLEKVFKTHDGRVILY